MYQVHDRRIEDKQDAEQYAALVARMDRASVSLFSVGAVDKSGPETLTLLAVYQPEGQVYDVQAAEARHAEDYAEAVRQGY